MKEVRSTADQPTGTARDRLDRVLVARGHFATRSRARDAVLRGTVAVDGVAVTRPGEIVDPSAAIAVTDEASRYVSRAALKLVAGLDAFGFDPHGRTALDVGASTGGFTQVLLERGAAHVVSVDVGHGQMDAALAVDPRVTSLEGLNARAMKASDLKDHAIGCVVSDVSFISLKLALPPALDIAAPGAFCVLLVKPQFEAGREAIGKGGIVKDPSLGAAIAADMAGWLSTLPGWSALGTVPAPIAGGDGNREYLLAGRKA